MALEEMSLIDALVELYRRTACTLPKDVLNTLQDIADGKDNHIDQKKQDQAKHIIEKVKKNPPDTPIKSDPVMPIFYLVLPEHWSEVDVIDSIKDATKIATQKGYLPQAIVDPLTGKSYDDNVGHGAPQIHARSWVKEFLRVELLLQSGESMAVSLEYSLPDKSIKAETDLEGVRRCIIDVVEKAHGLHWPAFLGVGFGGDRILSRLGARKQLYRRMDVPNSDAEINKIEQNLTKHEDIASVNICKFATLPGCFCVSVEYTGWTCRRQGFDYADGVVHDWIE